MSQPKGINITKSNIYNICDLKCAYNFDYHESNIIITKNNEINLSLTYENNNKSPPVEFNNAKYTVNKINIFSPSLHLFDGLTTAGEFMIEHIPELGGPNLIVCIPMIPSGNDTAATDLLTQIIDNVSIHAPSKGESTTINIPNFSLQHIVPKKPFIYYTGNYNNTTTDFIIFSTLNPIPLTQSSLNKLKSVIQPYNIIMKGGALFLNTKGPNTNKKGYKNDDIYISCKPTGSSEEISYISKPSQINKERFSFNIIKNSTFQEFLKYFLIFIVFIIFLLGINYAFNTITKSNIIKKTI
jgi:hypothetical protein